MARIIRDWNNPNGIPLHYDTKDGLSFVPVLIWLVVLLWVAMWGGYKLGEYRSARKAANACAEIVYQKEPSNEPAN